MSRDPMREYLEWARKERRRARFWALIGWLAIFLSGVVTVVVVWALLSLAFTVLG